MAMYKYKNVANIYVCRVLSCYTIARFILKILISSEYSNESVAKSGWVNRLVTKSLVN